MYVGVDVGGTKTLVAVLNDKGTVSEQAKFPTPKSYDDFLKGLTELLAGFQTKDFKAGGVGIPSTVFDRGRGLAVSFGNLPWCNVSIQSDLEKLFGCPMVVENDAKLAGLSEASLLRGQFAKVAYVTVSTGIGYALVVKGVIDTSIGDGGGRTMLLDHQRRLTPWEDFASGRAIVERYGKLASDITDAKTWQQISYDLAKGLIQLIAIMQPEVIVIGGAVGAYFDRYAKPLAAELDKYRLPQVQLPVLRRAQRPEAAVIYGCYQLAKQVYGRS